MQQTENEGNKGSHRSEQTSSQRIIKLTLEDSPGLRLSPQLEHERRVALFDLVQENEFALIEGSRGPYIVHLSIQGERLVFAVSDEKNQPLTRFRLPLADLKRIIKDYFVICGSYFQAIKTMTPSRIETIDMGRRGLHNEGAELLRDRLKAFATVDQNTARRLFTLVCVLQIRK